MLKFFLTLLLLLTPALAQATNYYVSTTGNDTTGDGLSTATAWKSFTKALASSGAMTGSPAGAGHTLNIADGVYGDGVSGTSTIALSGRTFQVGSELTIRCINQRQCRIHDDGAGQAVTLTNLTAGVIFDGLVFSSMNNSAEQATTDGIPFHANNTDRITIKNSLARNPNKYANVHPIYFINSRNGLVEDTEIYDFHRHAVVFFTSQNMVARRVYGNPRTGAISGGYVTSNGVGNGDSLVSMYPCTNCIVENSIADGTGSHNLYLNEMNATFNGGILMSGSKILGSICYSCGAGNGIYANPRTGVGSNYSPQNITLKHNFLDMTGNLSAAIRMTSNVTTTVDHNTLFGGTSGLVGDDSANGATTTSFIATNNIAKGFSGVGFSSSGYTTFSGTSNYYNGNGTSFSPAAGTWGAGNVTTDPQLGDCKLWPPDGSNAAIAGVGATILYRYQNGVLQDGTGGTIKTPLWDPTTGKFPHGVTDLDGINDNVGDSLFDFHKRVNVPYPGDTHSCSFPTSYTAGTPPANPVGLVPSQGTTNPSHIRTVTASKEALTAGVALYDVNGSVGTVSSVTSSCGSEALTEVGTVVTSPAYRRVYLFRRLNPTAGASCTISVTTSGAVTASVLISNEYDNVAAFGTAVTATGLSANPSVTAVVAAAAGNTILDMLATKCGLSSGACTITLNAGANQTMQADQGHLTLGDVRLATSEKVSTNGTGVTYTTGGNAYYAYLAVPMCAVSCDALTQVLTQVAGQVDSAFLANGLVQHLGAVNAANVDVPAGTSIAIVLQTDCTVADCASAGRKLYFSRNAGAYVPMLDTATTGISFHGSTADPLVVTGAISTNLSGVLTNIPGTTIHSVVTVPTADMSLNSSLVNRYVVKLEPTATATDTYEFKEYTDAGVALDALNPATADAKITVVASAPAGLSAPTNLRIAGITSATDVTLIWAPSTYQFFGGFNVYRSTTSGVYGVPVARITPTGARLTNTPVTQWSSRNLRAGTYYYIVKAFDLDGNESAAATEVSVTSAGF